MITDETLSPVHEVVNLLEQNGFRVFKVKEVMHGPCNPSGAIKLLIIPKNKVPANNLSQT